MNKKLLLSLVLVALVVTGTVYAQTAPARPSFFQNLISWLWPATPATTQVAAVSAAKPATPNPLITSLRAAADKAKGPAKVDPKVQPANPNKLTIKAGSKKTTNKAGTVISGRNSSGVAATPALEITQISGPSLVFTNQNNYWHSWTNINTVTSATADWGDGTQTSGQVNQWGVSYQHTYAHAGTYTATFYSSDVDGNQAQVSVVVSVTGQPTVSVQPPNATLALTYDSNHQESALLATYNVDIIAGAEDVVLPVGSLVYLYPYLESNNCTVPGLPEYHYCSAGVSSTPTTTPSTSNGLTIPAGTTKTLRVDARFNPQALFSGNYSGTLRGANFCGNSTGSCQWVELSQQVSTNSITVFGERAPYITAATVLGCLLPSDKCYLKISGIRFATSGNTVKVFNRQTGALVSQTNENPLSDEYGRAILHSMVDPLTGRYYPAGFYSVQVVSPTTGASNLVGFEMKGVSSVSPWSFVSASSQSTPGVNSVASSSVTGVINMSFRSNDGIMTKPVVTDFSARFVSSNGNIINELSRDLTVSPRDATLGAGGIYNTQLSGSIFSNRAPAGIYRMEITGIGYTVGGVRYTTTTGLENFVTPYVLLPGTTIPIPIPIPIPVPVSPISVALPRGGEVWPIGSVREINWLHPGQSYSPGRYKVYASTQSGSWYGLINDTGEKSLNWTVGRVTVNGVVKTLSPGNYWIQVIDSQAPVSAAGQSSVQAFSLGSVSLTSGVITAPTPTTPTLSLKVNDSSATTINSPINRRITLSWTHAGLRSCEVSARLSGLFPLPAEIAGPFSVPTLASGSSSFYIPLDTAYTAFGALMNGFVGQDLFIRLHCVTTGDAAMDRDVTVRLQAALTSSVPAPTPTVPTVPPVVTPTPTPPAPVPVSTISIDRPRAGDSWRLGEQRDITWLDAGPSGHSYSVAVYSGGLGYKQVGVATERKLRWTVGQTTDGSTLTPGAYQVYVLKNDGLGYNKTITSYTFNITANHAYLYGNSQTASVSDSLGSWWYETFPSWFGN